MNNYKNKLLPLMAFGLLLSQSVTSQESLATDSPENIELQVNALYAEAASLERDIGLLEKDLLFPPLTRVEVFLSVESELDFQLKSVAMILDGDEKSFHVYSASDLTALQMGGLQQFWEGNVALGEHQLRVDFQGLNAKNKVIKQSISTDFEKTRDGLAFEVQVKQGADAKTPLFSLKAWDRR
jgi:hypothetical protein